MFRNIVLFHGEKLLAPRQTLNLEDHHLSVVCDCLFYIIAATVHIWGPFALQLPENALCCVGRVTLNHVKFLSEDDPKASDTLCVCNICPEIVGAP
jgi:hypothetical protein